LHRLPTENELIVAVEIRLILLHGTELFYEAYSCNLLQHTCNPTLQLSGGILLRAITVSCKARTFVLCVSWIACG
jgi:hypothetical protein